jgi:hypothetical protein
MSDGNGQNVNLSQTQAAMNCLNSLFSLFFAGLEVLISIRPGNAPLPAENHGFGTVESFAEILT